jgi:hypothetical protein
MGGSYINMGSVAIWEVPDLIYVCTQDQIFNICIMYVVLFALRNKEAWQKYDQARAEKWQ